MRRTTIFLLVLLAFSSAFCSAQPGNPGGDPDSIYTEIIKTTEGNITFVVQSEQYAIIKPSGSVINKIPYNSYNKNPLGYVEYMPKDYDGKKRYPLIIWLHGLGEAGWGSMSELDKILNKQLFHWLKSNDIPFIALAPQDRNGYFGQYRLDEFCKWALEQYDDVIDTTSLHLAGLSAGGYGIKQFIIDNTETYRKFKSFTPMSTNFTTGNEYAHRIVDNDQYIWFHHGVNDGGSNKISTVQTFHKNVYDIDTTRSRLTAYVKMGHVAWNEVFDSSGPNWQYGQLQGTIVNGARESITYYHWTEGTWYDWMLGLSKPIPEPVPDPPSPIKVDPESMSVFEGYLQFKDSDGIEYRISLK